MQENGEMPVNAEFAGLFFFGMAQVFMKECFTLRLKELTENTDLNFIYTIRDFQIFPDEFPDAHYRFAGPSIGDRAEQDFDFAKASRLPDAPPVYISPGALLNTSAKFYRLCIDAFRDEPVSVIISIAILSRS